MIELKNICILPKFDCFTSSKIQHGGHFFLGVAIAVDVGGLEVIVVERLGREAVATIKVVAVATAKAVAATKAITVTTAKCVAAAPAEAVPTV